MVKVTMTSVVMGLLMMAVVVAGKDHHLNHHHHHHHHQRKSASAPAPSTDCSTIVYDMIDCVGYVTAGSNLTEPSMECCNGFKTVLNTDAQCVCEAIKESAQMGIAVNNTRAKGLPSACGESSAPDCGFPDSGDSPSASPVAPPESSPSATPSTVAPSPSDEELSGGSPAPSSISSAYTTAFSFAFAVFGLVLSAL